MRVQQKNEGVAGLILIALGLITLVATPASAQTYDDGVGTLSTTYCPQLSQTIVRGSRGNQVLELQKFFSNYYVIPPTDIQTGYFGPITQSYAIKFQKEQGLPSYGIVGPMTRAVITRICDEGNAPTIFTASPVSGTAPLTVSFTGNELKDPYYYSYLIEFGDGQGDLFPKNCEEGPCGTIRDTHHTYTTAGTYVAVLQEFNDAADCATGMVCGVKLGSVTIVVTSPSTSNVR
jgi:hypothetical protein